MTQTSTKRLSRTSLRLMPFYITLYMSLCIYQNYFTVYLNQLGIDPATLGVLMSLAPLSAMLGQPVWGNAGDRAKHKNTLLVVLTLAAAVMMLLLGLSRAVWYIGALICGYSFFYMSIQPLGDAIALESLGAEGKPFGPVRASGTLAFALCSAVSGALMTGHIELTTVVTAAALVVTAAASLAMPKVRGHRSANARGSFRALLSIPRLPVMLAFSCCMMIGMSFYYNFYPVFFTAELGGSTKMLGLAFCVSALSEVPFLIFSDKLFDRLGVGGILCASAATMCVRWAVLSQVQTPVGALLTQLLHFACFLPMTFAMMKFINAIVPPDYKAAGQLLYTVFTLSAARIAGSLVGGALAQLMGKRAMFLVGCGFTLATLVCFGIYCRRHSRELLEMSRGKMPAVPDGKMPNA